MYVFSDVLLLLLFLLVIITRIKSPRKIQEIIVVLVIPCKAESTTPTVRLFRCAQRFCDVGGEILKTDNKSLMCPCTPTYVRDIQVHAEHCFECSSMESRNSGSLYSEYIRAASDLVNLSALFNHLISVHTHWIQ